MESITKNLEDSLKEKIDNFGVSEMYTPLSIAKKEIWRRWNDTTLRKKVEDFLGGDIPRVLKKEPRAVLARHVASPNNEFFQYLELANMLELEPVCLEYLDDKFTHENEDKYYLGKMVFCDGAGKKGGERLSAKKVVDFEKAEGKAFVNLKTLQGEDFIAFHHRMLDCIEDKAGCIIADESIWVKNNGLIPGAFYEKFLALFVCFGVLFENYLVNKNEKEFTNKIVIPNFKKIKNIFGLNPLIVKIYPSENENDLYWRYYPGKIKKLIDK